MTYDQLMAQFGGPTAAAKAIGLKNRRQVDNWNRQGRIPSKYQLRYERITQLKADKESHAEAAEFLPSKAQRKEARA